MNQSALKTFAQDARRKLRDLVGARLDYVLTADTAELRQQAAQLNELRSALQTEGRDPLIERVAYTWFNRLAALRFMDANDYHPFGVRVITPATANETLPELLQQARAGALDADLASVPTSNPTLTTGQLITELLTGRIPVDHPEAQVFKLLLVASCNYYHQLMPFMFEKIGDATELLLPEDLLTEHSIVADFRENLTDQDCRNEEVLGWFYQYYVSEKKDTVMARNAAVPKEDIPAVTQLFTPHWIVRYLVENSLGRLWLLNHPSSRLREKMLFYIEGEPETDFLKITKPEQIRLLDPAGGSGHMLTYAFDLLYAIYEEEGYDAPEIPGLILKHNLYGVDICDRAVALAAFALCMKARAKDNRFFRRVVQPNLISLQEVRFGDGELSAYFEALNTQPSALNPQFTKLLYQFEEAKNFGSLIQPCLPEAEIIVVRAKLSTLNSQLSTRDLSVALTHSKVLSVLDQAEYLTRRYHVVVANPPYLGRNSMNPQMRIHADEVFPKAKADLYAMFIERCRQLPFEHGLFAMITMHSWMFLISFKALRNAIAKEERLCSMLHLGPRAFDSIGGEVVQTVAFVCQTRIASNSYAFFFRLVDGQSEAEKMAMLEADLRDADSPRRFVRDPKRFTALPDGVFGYWLSERAQEAFIKGKSLAAIAKPRQGLATTNNGVFLRFWHEVPLRQFTRDCHSLQECSASPTKWYPVNKGGTFRRWYGNHDYVVNFAYGGKAICDYIDNTPGVRVKSSGRVINREFYFREGITWSSLGTSFLAMRFSPRGRIFETKGSTCFFESHQMLLEVLGFTNSCLVNPFISILAPTLDFHEGPVGNLPIITTGEQAVARNVELCISLARADWDSFETSWDFSGLPSLQQALKRPTLAASWQNWKARCDEAIRRMQELETENNRLLIAAYGLQEELKPEVPEDQITLARADARKDTAAFLSYAVGCMMGRYSLDAPGLILADAGSTVEDFHRIVAEKQSAPGSQPSTANPQPSSGFQPDSDGIIPVLDGEWFADDIVGQFRDFLRATYGDENLAENLAFVEASLGKSDAKTGKAKPIDLRTYFVREFYKDHLKTYKKRPIYWMFSSPAGSFQALVYLHRYTKDTLHLLLNEYVRKFIEKLEERQRHLNGVRLNEGSRPGDVTKATKELVKIEKTLKELRDWERNVLLPLAQQRIELDLDDGVKVNYQKFKGAVVPIPGFEKQEEE
jgi:hypothetical protein